MKLDPDIPIVQNEAAIMTTLAAELFLKRLANQSQKICKNRGKNTIRWVQYNKYKHEFPIPAQLLFLIDRLAVHWICRIAVICVFANSHGRCYSSSFFAYIGGVRIYIVYIYIYMCLCVCALCTVTKTLQMPEPMILPWHSWRRSFPEAELHSHKRMRLLRSSIYSTVY